MKYDEKFDSAYDAGKFEPTIYEKWLASGYFNPDNCITDGIADPEAEPFSIVLPPPNITGHLHLGHAARIAVQDTLVRYARMNGRPTLYIPGTDHAAIATQSKFEKLHQKQTGKRRSDYSREEFFNLVNEYALKNQGYIIKQLKQSGASLDWSRLAFTLDDDRQLSVRTAFKKMYDAGLIYQRDRIVNWDPKGQTTVSDDEIVHESGQAILYTFKYATDFPIPVATTRLETKVGDTAVAVHPDDKRYQQYIGKTFVIDNFCGVELKLQVIASEEVDPEYGTGALGVTPAHSSTDWQMAEDNNLDTKVVINEYAKMTDQAGRLLAGQKTTDARETVAVWLRDKGLMMDEESTVQNLSRAERTGGVIEPLPKLQWWVAVNQEFIIEHSEINGIESGSKTTLKDLMMQAVKQGQIDIIPERYARVYYDWINKLRDWNISRQIIYGHQVPVWYRGEEIYVGLDSPGNGWVQDSDTLDTWFSSGLWPFSTLGWPDSTPDLKKYFPNTLLETAHDIIFFWNARMILMSTFLTGKVPFYTAYFSGFVNDEKNQKMSKSKGNGIEPAEIATDYGTDALRMALLVGVGPGANNPFGRNKAKAYRNFANKMWNASRFVLLSLPENYQHSATRLNDSDQKLVSELSQLVTEVTADISEYRLHLASEKLYGYFWHTFADQIIESKKELVGDNYQATNLDSQSAAYTLFEILTTCLKMLHPFMPFITEEIWSSLPHGSDKLLLVTNWPQQKND